MSVRINPKPSDIEFGLESLPNARDVKKLSQKIKKLEDSLKKTDAAFDELWKNAKKEAPNPRFTHPTIKHVKLSELAYPIENLKNCKISLKKYQQRLEEYKTSLEEQNTPIPEKKLKKIKSNFDKIEKLLNDTEKKGAGMAGTQLLVYLSVFFEQIARMLAEAVEGIRRAGQIR